MSKDFDFSQIFINFAKVWTEFFKSYVRTVYHEENT